MKTAFLLLLLTVSSAPGSASSAATPYAVAVLPTPVFNTPDIAPLFGGSDGKTLRSDSCGQMRELEFIALPGTSFRVEQVLAHGKVLRVATDDYPHPSESGFFVDSRFVETRTERPPNRPRSLPPRATVIASLLAAQGSRYVWGGNVRSGIPEMLSAYPPGQLSERDSARWQLRGLDCSGLLYDSTGGFTPRNTSALVSFGTAVPVAGLPVRQMVSRLEPLDLIVWNGHVLIVLDRERLIESSLGCSGKMGGVRVRKLRPALEKLLKSRKPLDDTGELARTKGFVVRRWYGPDN